jgi:hypothetical protein
MCKKTVLILIFSCCYFSLVHSQSMKIKKNDGTVITYSINEIKKITFSTITISEDQHNKEYPAESLSSPENYPNPFNSSTTISYNIPQTGDVEISIYDLKGQRIKTYQIGKTPPGNYYLEWDGKNEKGQKVISGTYIYKIIYNETIRSNKMLLIK